MEQEFIGKIGTRIKCNAIGFSSPVIGTIKYIYDNTAVIFVEQIHPIDETTAIEKNYMAMILFEEIIATKILKKS